MKRIDIMESIFSKFKMKCLLSILTILVSDKLNWYLKMERKVNEVGMRVWKYSNKGRRADCLKKISPTYLILPYDNKFVPGISRGNWNQNKRLWWKKKKAVSEIQLNFRKE